MATEHFTNDLVVSRQDAGRPNDEIEPLVRQQLQARLAGTGQRLIGVDIHTARFAVPGADNSMRLEVKYWTEPIEDEGRTETT